MTRRATASTVLLLCVATLVTACSSTGPAGSPTASPSPSASASALPSATTSPSELAEPAEPTVVAPGASVDFLSPTGNIRCGMSSQSAVCEVKQRLYDPPPKPADCDLDHGSMIGVGREGPAVFLCHGDTGFGVPTPVLEYGRSTTNGLFMCRSSQEGVSCEASGGRHGFEIARDSYRVF